MAAGFVDGKCCYGLAVRQGVVSGGGLDSGDAAVLEECRPQRHHPGPAAAGPRHLAGKAMIVVSYCQITPPIDHDHGNRRPGGPQPRPHQDQTSVLIICAPYHDTFRPQITDCIRADSGKVSLNRCATGQSSPGGRNGLSRGSSTRACRLYRRCRSRWDRAERVLQLTLVRLTPRPQGFRGRRW